MYNILENTHRAGSSSGGGGEIDYDNPDAVLGSRVRQVPSLGSALDSSHEVADSLSPIGDTVDVSDSVPPKSPFHEMPSTSLERVESDGGTRRHQPATEHSNCGVDCDFDSTVAVIGRDI